MKVTIKEVSTKSDLKKFVRFPNKMYRDNKYYVPQLESSDLDALDRKKNHAFEFCDSCYWLAYDQNDKIVGRIAGIVNHQYNKKTGVNYASFGFLDFVDDADVSKALLDTVEKWAKDNNLTILTGPLGFLEFDASGILVEGFDEIPTAYGKYNYPYYEQHILDYGFTKDIDWVEYNVKIPDVIPERYERMYNIVIQKSNLHVIKLKNKRELRNYFDSVFDLMNRAYSKIHGYSELSQGQIEDLKNQFVPMLNIEFVTLVANEQDKIVGFGVCLPSVSKALQKAHGKMFPFGFIHLLYALKHNDTLDTLLISVDDEYKNKGVTALIFHEISKAIKHFGITNIETTRELENNFNVQNLWNQFNPRLHKRARCYIKDLTKD